MRRRLILLLNTLLLACAETAPDHQQDPAEDYAKEEEAVPPVIIFDAVPLTTTFQRFFGISTEIFTPQQRKALGTISYVGETAELLNGTTKRQLDQAYLRTLRTVLLDQCQQLAKKEAQALDNATVGDIFTEHTLIKRYGAPLPTEVSATMSRMFGYHQEQHRGASNYATLMKKNLANLEGNNGDKATQHEALQQQYVLLCMAIGQDTRVYLR